MPEEMVVISSAGLEYQAKISSLLCLPHACPCRPLLKKQQNSLFDYLISVLFLLAYENEDQLLWDPNILPEREVEEFLYRVVKRQWDELSGSSLPEGEVVKDNEQVSLEAPAAHTDPGGAGPTVPRSLQRSE